MACAPTPADEAAAAKSEQIREVLRRAEVLADRAWLLGPALALAGALLGLVLRPRSTAGAT